LTGKSDESHSEIPYRILLSIVLCEKYSYGLNVTPALLLKLTQYLFCAEIFSPAEKRNKTIETKNPDLK
jgi:hypothetical protein